MPPKASSGPPLRLNGEQTALLEKMNPQFKERHRSGEPCGVLGTGPVTQPGHLPSRHHQGGRRAGVGKVYLHSVVDTFSSYGFGRAAFRFLHTSKQPEAAVAVLHNDVLPFYASKKLKVSAVLTDNGREYCGTDAHPFQIYLDLNDIEHRTTQVRRPQTNGFVADAARSASTAPSRRSSFRAPFVSGSI